MSKCANCGKDDANNICNKCKQVKYCNAICKKVHKKKHKKDCEEHCRLAVERAAKLHDEKLFKHPSSQYGDCPICFLRLPYLASGRSYMACCGKLICSGCTYAPVYDNQGNEVDNQKCVFCRTPWPNEEEMIKRLKKRVEAGDAYAIYNLGCYYDKGMYGIPQNYTKALELCVGEMEENAGNMNRAIKHYMIAVGSGHNDSLKQIQQLYSNGHATKEDYKKALQLYQTYLGEIKSPQRDEAAAADDQYRYY